MQVLRYANRVPLQFQPAACAITQSVIGNNWRAYGLSQSRGQFPSGPVTVMVHMASVWVPFTSESKEAIAGYPEIMKELRLGLQAVGTQARDVPQPPETRAPGRRTARDFPAVPRRGRNGRRIDQGLRRRPKEGTVWPIAAGRETQDGRGRHQLDEQRQEGRFSPSEDFGENVLIVEFREEQSMSREYRHGRRNQERKHSDNGNAHRQGQEDPRLDPRSGRRRGSVRRPRHGRRMWTFLRGRCPTCDSTNRKRSSKWAAARVAASFSICPRPGATCRRCWSARGASN